jgi:uncharacterized membrane protein
MDTTTAMEYWLFLNRWLHFLAGITWIGMLYYFNLVQTPFFGTELGGQARSPMLRGLVPEALWWFRWGAMLTFITGWLMILTMWGHYSFPLSSSYMTKILTGGLMGSMMWANVWFVIWPAQKVVIASATQVAGGGQALPEAAARGARAGLASRTNVLLSIGMLLFMGSAYHLNSLAPNGGNALYWILFFALLGAIEANALVGSGQARQKPLSTVRGTIHAGLGVAVALFAIMKITTG